MTDPELEKRQFQFGGEITNVICTKEGGITNYYILEKTLHAQLANEKSEGTTTNGTCRERGEAEVGVGDEATVEPGERDEVAHAAEHDERGGYGKPPADLAAEERLRRALHHRP